MNFKDEPIISRDWNDGGYREVAIPEETDPDPLVVANDRLKCYRIYYHSGMDNSKLILLREPVVKSLERVNELLRPYDLEMLVVDGFRSVYTQALLWRNILKVVSKGVAPESLSPLELLTFGLQADEIGSYAQAKKTRTFHSLVESCMSDGPLLVDFAIYMQGHPGLEKTPREMAMLYITLLVNLGEVYQVPLDIAAHTAHGNGGTEDSRLLNVSTGRQVCLGTPYDWTDTRLCSVDSFEDESKFELWRQSQVENREMAEYLVECGIVDPVTIDDFRRVRDFRRILYWATEEVGVGRYRQEFWHRTHGNQFGGKQAKTHLGAGNSCHAMSRGLVDEKGEPLVVWGNKAAHEMAAKIIG